jgi:hypothetical protein
MSSLLQILWRTGACAVLLLVCIWPALYNGQPLWFVDTTGYIRGADAGFSKVSHRRSVWSEEQEDAAGAAASAKPGRKALVRPSMNSISRKVVLAGRSIYYGALLYAGHLTGRFWLVVLVQAAAVLVAIALTLNRFELFTWLRFSGIAVVLAAVTPMAFFVSYLMPDVFAGITILAVANLLTADAAAARWGMTASWFVLLSVSLLFHTSHEMIAVLLTLVGVVGLLLARAAISWRAVAAIGAALLVGAGGEAFFNLATKKLVGASPLRPPFLMARMVMDGPGYRYLAAKCPGVGLAVCEFVARIPQLPKIARYRPPSDEFLWNTDPAAGVFGAADPATQRRLADEQSRFALTTLAFDPPGVSAAFLRDVAQQISLFSLKEFALDPGARGFFLSHLPEPYLSAMQNTRLWRGELPIQELSRLTAVSTMVAALFLAACFLLRRTASRGGFGADGGLFVFAALTVAGILLDAVICGGISTPHDRYEARVIWLLPFAGMLLLLQRVALAVALGERLQMAQERHAVRPGAEERGKCRYGTPDFRCLGGLRLLQLYRLRQGVSAAVQGARPRLGSGRGVPALPR